MGPDGLTRHDRDLIRDVLARYPEVQRVTLFGSRAMGTFGRGSDIDLALEGPDLDSRTLTQIANELEDSDLPYKVDLLLRDEQLDPKLEAHIRRHGKPFGWEQTTLGEFVTLQRGHDLTEAEREPGTVPVVGAAGQNGFHNKAIAKGPGIVVGRSGASFGQVHFCKTDFWPHNTGLYVTDFRGNDPRFAFYYLKALDFSRYNSGSAQPSLNRNYIYTIEVQIPPLAEQRAIAGVLSALDDKIEQNRRTARVLERLARAIFRAWFVDFEPVKAKAAGASAFPSMPQPVFDALPTRFADSEIGPVPEGWEVREFGEVLVLAYGKALKADDRQTGQIPVYGSNGQVGWHNEAIAAGPGIVVGRKGNPGTVKWSNGPFFPIDTTFFVQLADSSSSLPLLFYQLDAADLGRLATDSAVPGVNRNMIYSERCIVPHRTILAAFDRLLLELWELQTALMKESGNLAQMRDYLLPYLLRGSVRVRGASPEPKQSTQ